MKRCAIYCLAYRELSCNMVSLMKHEEYMFQNVCTDKGVKRNGFFFLDALAIHLLRLLIIFKIAC